MAYAIAYKCLRGWTTFVRKTLSKDVILSAPFSAMGDVVLTDHYELDETLSLLPVYHRVYPGSFLRPAGAQKFGLVIKELGGDGFAAGLSDAASAYAFVTFLAFPFTIDQATGLERPYGYISLAPFDISRAGMALSLWHTSYFNGPVGMLAGGMDDYDYTTGTCFTAAHDGLVTSIGFGWYYRLVGVGASVGMAVVFKDVDLIVVPSI